MSEEVCRAARNQSLSPVSRRIRTWILDIPERNRKPGIISSSGSGGYDCCWTLVSRWVRCSLAGSHLNQTRSSAWDITEGWIEIFKQKGCQTRRHNRSTILSSWRKEKTQTLCFGTSIHSSTSGSWVKWLAYEQAVKQQRMRTRNHRLSGRRKALLLGKRAGAEKEEEEGEGGAAEQTRGKGEDWLLPSTRTITRVRTRNGS